MSPTPTSDGMPQVGETIDDFLIVEQLGKGAFATVYLARQRSIQRTVALKVSPVMGTEALVLAQLDHPNIVRVFDQRDLTARSLRLLYMEYVSAGTLQDAVERVKATPEAERSGQLLLDVIDEHLAARDERPPRDSQFRERLAELGWPEAVCLLGAELAQALSHAHRNDVLHKDVKPANALLDAGGHPKLADFNISSHGEADADASESAGGTLLYMSPEQLRAVSPFHSETADAVDGRADLYSLGVVLWELLTGAPPYPEPGTFAGDWRKLIDELIETHSNAPTDEAAKALPEQRPLMMEGVLRSCLAADPDDRPADADTLAHELTLCLNPRAQALMAPRTTGWISWVRRFPILAVLLVTVIPNALLSALNVSYNLGVVVEKETLSAFLTQVSVVNGLAFGIGLIAMFVAFRPFARVVKATHVGDAVPAPELELARKRGLVFGDFMSAITFPLWIIGGLAFPIWWQLNDGDANLNAYFHFGASNALFGVLAATAVFFNATWIVMHALYPILIDQSARESGLQEGMRALEARSNRYFIACMGVPFASLIVLALVQPKSQLAYLALGVIGIVAFAISFFVLNALRRDVNALSEALEPLGGAR